MENTILLCDRCNNDTFYMVDNHNLLCTSCETEMINIQWTWTENEEEYIELELEDGSKHNLGMIK